jgi:hypothetical protein
VQPPPAALPCRLPAHLTLLLLLLLLLSRAYATAILEIAPTGHLLLPLLLRLLLLLMWCACLGSVHDLLVMLLPSELHVHWGCSHWGLMQHVHHWGLMQHGQGLSALELLLLLQTVPPGLTAGVVAIILMLQLERGHAERVCAEGGQLVVG